MKPDNKLGKLRFDPEEGFETLRAEARKVFALSKKDLDLKVAAERQKNQRRRRRKDA